MAEERPILYSFRRCPYAIRARLALAAAGLRPGVALELREVQLAAKPPELLEASARGTVPVLVLPPGAEQPGDERAGAEEPGAAVLSESLAIMHWALERADPGGWLAGWSAAERESGAALIAENDGPFKHHLDRWRYPDRFGTDEAAADHHAAALAILRRWSERMAAGGWLLGARPALADVALLPFVRQFRHTDPAGFAAAAGLEPLRRWLEHWLAAPELAAVLAPPWAERRPWLSGRWVYHLARRQEWRQARQAGLYERSSRGLSLAEVGFIHLSQAHQVAGTEQRFFAGAGPLTLLAIDPTALGPALRLEPAENGELFPHLYGPLPLQAVVAALPWGEGQGDAIGLPPAAIQPC